MKNASLIEALADCPSSCGWCVHQCSDEDKYEILVTCIKIQKECLLICKTFYSILADKSAYLVVSFMEHFEKFAENVRQKSISEKKAVYRSKYKNGNRFSGTGCSHIFQIALSLEESFLNELYKSDL